MAAGDTPGLPQLNSFGLNMTLAKELLEHGEREVVLEYLDLVSKFWKKFFAYWKLRKWRKAIRNGGIPDFKAHFFN